MKTVRIGLLGFGTVGQGLVSILRKEKQRLLDRTGMVFEVKAVCDRSWQKKVSQLEHIPAHFEASPVLSDPEIDIIVELIGGISPAGDYVKQALTNGKHIVTANKALLARDGAAIFALASEKKKEIGFEAAVAGALPVIKSLRRSLVANEIRAMYGILNGTCNFIITRMQDDVMDYREALKLAQEKGFAEADPQFDVSGKDAAQKLSLLSSLAFDCRISEDDIYTEGITSIRPVDLNIAESMGWVIRLLAVAKRKEDGSLHLRVHPAMIHQDHILASVKDEKNAVFFDTSYSGPTLVMGLGAGANPTAAAVISDLVAISRHESGFPERWISTTGTFVPFRDYSYRFYLRFQTKEQTGVLADIARILADFGISIATVHQQEGAEPVDVVVITHHANERALVEAIEKIDNLSVIMAPTVYIRIQDEI